MINSIEFNMINVDLQILDALFLHLDWLNFFSQSLLND